MNSMTHSVAPEDVMAFLDGELPQDERNVLHAHIAECQECWALAEELRSVSHNLAQWSVPELPVAVQRDVLDQASKAIAASAKRRHSRLRPWMLPATGALAFILLLSIGSMQHHSVRMARMAPLRSDENASAISPYVTPAPAPSSLPEARTGGAFIPADRVDNLPVDKYAYSLAKISPGLSATRGPSPDPAPMIARTVSLTILVHDVGAARAALDALLAQHHGYPASMTVNTPENSARSIEASLRVPAGELTAALIPLRAFGRVQSEVQSGEEVTQKHADLAQRIKTARETEEQLRDILTHRTGKIDEVLQVEEEASRVRGEIENMEAEQQGLDHRVAFATIELQLSEEYKTPITASQGQLGTETHNAFAAGYKHLSGALTGIFLVLLEFGPVVVLWTTILAVPAWLLWRRYRRSGARY